MAISSSLADQKWQHHLLVADEEMWLRTRKAMRLLAHHQGDWIIDALHNPHWSRRGHIADAVAYVELVRLMEMERVFLSVATANAWAAPNGNLKANAAALDIRGVKASVENAPKDFDGSVHLTEPVDMRCLYDTEQKIDPNMPPSFWCDGVFPLEIGGVTLSKCVANLMRSGRLARLPFEQGMLVEEEPCLYLFVLQGSPDYPTRMADYVSNQPRFYARFPDQK